MSEALRRRRVLFVHPNMSPFIQADIDVLKRTFDVRIVDLSKRKASVGDKLGAAWELFRGVASSDVCFAWFAEGHSKWMVFLSRIFRRPSIVVVGGYEVAKLPEIEYGSLINPRKTKVVRYVLEHATRVLPVDESLKDEAKRRLGVRGENIVPVHTGHDPVKFSSAGPKERMALTVGFVNKSNCRRKGLAVFVEAARHLPDVKFVLVGMSDNEWSASLRQKAPPNVEFVPAVAHDQLLGYYRRAKVYCQLSMFEGLPNALCEAMLCECVPVGTEVCGIPTAIGDTGFYVPVGDPKASAEAIEMALKSDKGKAARARIIDYFSIEKREKRLAEIIGELLS